MSSFLTISFFVLYFFLSLISYCHLGQLREDINVTIEEREILKSTANKTTIYLNNELIRIETLQKEEDKMKLFIENYKHGNTS